MSTRMEILDLIDHALTKHLGPDRVSRRDDGVLVVAGTSEAFLVQALVVDAPKGVDVFNFGKELVEFIRNKGLTMTTAVNADQEDSDGEAFHTSQNGDRWLLVTDKGGRRFVRHVSNRSSGGVAELTDLQSFRDREPHSPQNQALEDLVRE